MITKRNITVIKRRAVSLFRTLTILALTVPILNSTAKAQADPQENAGGITSPIEGSWIFSVDAGPVSFTALASFSAGVSSSAGLGTTIQSTPFPCDQQI